MSALPPGSLRRALPVLPALLLLGACSSYTPVPTVSSKPSADAVTAAVVGQEYAALDPSAREAELRRLSAAVERRLVTLSGLEEELGGAAAADAAYLALSRTLVGGAREAARARSFGRFGGSAPAADQPTTGGLMVGNVVVAALGAEAVTSSTNDTIPTAPVTRKPSGKDGPGRPTSTITATVDEASMVAESEDTVDGVTGRLRTVVTVNPCPDAKGRFTSTTTMTVAISGATGRTGANLTIDVEIEGQVDDDAHLVSFEVDTRTRSETSTAGTGPVVDQTVGWTDTDGKQHNYRAEIARTGANVPDGFISDQVKWGLMTAMMLQDKAVDAARTGWESGRCVSLKPTTTPARRTGLAPSATLALVAPPRSRVDGGPVGGTVTATMTGATSVDPSATEVPADATFTVMAPGTKNKRSTVALEARSKRGVARAKVVVDTKAGAYAANGRSGNIRFKGTVADLTEPFTIRGGGGARLTFSYTPSDAGGRSGTMTYTGTVGGLELSGSGGYSIAGDEGGVLLLTQGSKGCAAGPLGCVGGVAEITLTPSGS
jgi:hypothetical protein